MISISSRSSWLDCGISHGIYCIKSTDNTQLFRDRGKGAKHVDKANPQININHNADDIK